MNNERFFRYDFFVLRAPTFSIEALLDLNEILNKIEKNNTDAVAWNRLRAIFSDPLFVEAVYFASKDLYAALKDWLDNITQHDAKSGKLLKSLHRYYSRMCTRCTPFGLFAGCAYGSISNAPTCIHFAGEKIRKHARFDMGYVAELSKSIVANPGIQGQVKFHVNNTLYANGDRYIYVENMMKGGRSNYVMSALTASPYIEKVIERAKAGATLKELEDRIIDADVAEEAVQKFIRELIRVQVLTSELQPTVTGEDFVRLLITRLGELQHTTAIREPLVKAHQLINRELSDLAVYMEAERLAKLLIPGKEVEVIIQEDVHYAMKTNNISSKVIDDIVKTSERLWATMAPHVSPDLRAFMHRFSARYEEQEIPLVMALDPDTGIGYGLAVSGVAENMPLLDGLAIKAHGDDDKIARGAFGRLLSEKMKLFFRENTPVISLTEEDIDKLVAANNGVTGPVQNNSAYIFGSILAASQEGVDNDQYQFVAFQLHSYSVGRMLGRFAQGDDALREKLAACIADEERANPGLVLAELVHMPEGHSANVVLRPRFRPFEIPYLCNTAAGKEHTININDLMVSVRNRRVVLRSKTLNREVLPQVTNAFNAQKGQPMYRFLTDIRSQYIVPPFQWEWTGYYEEPCLPRIVYKNFILSRARWRLNRESNDTLATTGMIDAFFQRIRAQYNIPRYVVLAQDGDNELFTDLDNSFCRQQVARQLKKRDVFLIEFLHTPENCFIRDGKGGYNNQVVIPLGTRRPAFPDTGTGPLSASSDRTGTERHFPPGSEWLYVKIYGGNKTLDALLVNVIKPFAENALQKKAIDKWFFIRYNDPDGHLRVRFHQSENRAAWLELLPALNSAIAPFIKNNRIARMMVDTYAREVERYGTSAIIESETLFFADSVAVADFLDLIEGDEGEQLRWQAGLYSVDRLLNDFAFDLPEKKQLISAIRETFFQEFSNNNKSDALRLERSLNDKYRQHSPQIKHVLSAGLSPETADMMDCFRKRSMANTTTIAALKEKLSAYDRPDAALKKLVTSYIHMHMNRLFLSRQRAHELVVYHYLSKYYQSLIAREKQPPVNA